MKKIILSGAGALACVFFITAGCKTQHTTSSADKKGLLNEIITVAEVERIETTLAADDMMGRKVFTPGIEKAADFIAAEFAAIGLQPLQGLTGFRQEFSVVRTKPVAASAVLDGVAQDEKTIKAITGLEQLRVTNSDAFEYVIIKPGDNFSALARTYMQSARNIIVWVDKSFAAAFNGLRIRSFMVKPDNSIVFVLADKKPETFEIEIKQEVTEQQLANVAAMLPGKGKKNEYVIFSGHYDHLGTGKPVDGDSIYNGANDDAAGVTAMLMLAKYFKALGNNGRTILFAAFTAEEVGGYGSQYFSKQFDADKVMAMFNIEMIGTDSKWGKNSAFITGYEKTDMGKILEKNLVGTGFTFYPDPYPDLQLFYRSDNATLARLGVPAHTISTSKMDNEPHYHKVSDHAETLDLANMTEIIKSIALSSRTIVAGEDTPSRVKVEDLR